MADNNPTIEEMRDSFDTESLTNDSYDPAMEAMRSEITGESAVMPENLEAEPETPWAQNLAESVFDYGTQLSSSIPLVTPLSDAALAAGYTLANIGREGYNPIEEYGQQMGNIMSAREALSSQAQERSPTASFLGSMTGGAPIPTGGVGVMGRAAYESGLAGIDALLRGRTQGQAGGEMITAGGFQAAMGALPWLRGIFPGTEVTPDIVNKAWGRVSGWLTPSSKLKPEDVADLYQDVQGRRLVRAYERGEDLRRRGEEGVPSFVQATKDVAEELQESFRTMQREFGGRYANLKRDFVKESGYQDFMNSVDSIKHIEDIANVLDEYPHVYSSDVKKQIQNSLKLFTEGFPLKDGERALTFKQLNERWKPRIDSLRKKFDKAKTGQERDAIAKNIALVHNNWNQELVKSTSMTKEGLIKFKQKMDDMIEGYSKAKDPSIFATKQDDIELITTLRNNVNTFLRKDFIKSENMVNANADYATFKEGVSEIFDFLRDSKQVGYGSVDPHKLYQGITTQGIRSSEKFWSGINKMKDYITTDDKQINEVVEKAGIKPAFQRMMQLVDVLQKKQQLFGARTAQGPSGMAIQEATKQLMISSGDKKRIAFAMLTAPVTNPLGWVNMVDNFAEAFSTTKAKIDPAPLEKWWGRASRKVFKIWPGMLGASAKKHPTRLPQADLRTPSLISNIPVWPSEIMGRIAEDPAKAATKGIVRPMKYYTMPKGDEFVGFDPANTELLKPFPWSPEIEQDESAVMPENVRKVD